MILQWYMFKKHGVIMVQVKENLSTVEHVQKHGIIMVGLKIYMILP